MATKKSADKKMSKTAFVKSQPLALSAKQVVDKAKEQGMTLTDKYVYTVRSAAKAKAQKQRPKGAATKPAIVKAVKTGSNSVEDLLRAAASEIGLSKAISLLLEQQNAVRSVLGG
jgi:hypothetical protein